MTRSAGARRVAVPGEGVTHQHCVGCVCVEGAPGLEGHLHRTEVTTPFEMEATVLREAVEPAMTDRRTGQPRTGRGQARPDRGPGVWGWLVQRINDLGSRGLGPRFGATRTDPTARKYTIAVSRTRSCCH